MDPDPQNVHSAWDAVALVVHTFVPETMVDIRLAVVFAILPFVMIGWLSWEARRG